MNGNLLMTLRLKRYMNHRGRLIIQGLINAS
jgi:hypothetical protein